MLERVQESGLGRKSWDLWGKEAELGTSVVDLGAKWHARGSWFDYVNTICHTKAE
jgi:hypothetical protein